MHSLFDLSGRHALLTGASRGLGLAMARGLASAGAHVTINGRDEAALAKAVEGLRAEGYRADGVVCDITRAVDVEAKLSAITPIRPAST